MLSNKNYINNFFLVFLLSVLTGLSSIIAQPDLATVYHVNPTKFQVLNGKTLPLQRLKLDKFTLKVTPGEYEPLSLLIKPNRPLTNVTVNISEFRNEQYSMPSSIIDPYLVKVWWQSSISHDYQQGPKYFLNKTEDYNPNYPMPDSLVGELLVKDDNLIRVTIPYNPNLKNEIRMKRKSDGKVSYYNLSRSTDRMPGDNKGVGYEIKDAETLLPFQMTDSRNKQLWFIVNVPVRQKAGKYTGEITISSDFGIIQTIPVEIVVLPFVFSKPVVTYGIYYDGVVGDYETDYGFGSGYRNPEQYEIEMLDMLKHGITFPTVLNNQYTQDFVAKIRNSLGFPRDKIFINSTCVPMERYYANITGERGYESYGWEYITNYILDYKKALNAAGYPNSAIYFMGKDEANGSKLYYLRNLYDWMINSIGVNVWAAIDVRGMAAQDFLECFPIIGDLLSQPILMGYRNTFFDEAETKKAIADWTSVGKKPFMYNAPQVASENPEIYRKNMGLRLYFEGYLGSFEYDYMVQKGPSVWNDWDISEIGWRGPLRDMVYTYPVSNGLINTIQWEGRREGYDDIRYLSTLLDEMSNSTDNTLVSEINNFINSLDYGWEAKPDMDAVRDRMIEYILRLKNYEVGFEISGANALNNIEIIIDFSNNLEKSSAENSGNYSISDGIEVLNATLSSKGNQVKLNTTPRQNDKVYRVTVQNINDVNGTLITSSANFAFFSFSSSLTPIVLYDFIRRDNTNIVYDVSERGEPLNLTISDSRAVTWNNGSLSIHSPVNIASMRPASKITEACSKTNEITIEAWIKPANLSQNGPARIVSLAQNTSNRNFMLGQGINGGPSNVFEARLRTTATNSNGFPSTSSLTGSVTMDLMHVVYTRDSYGHARLYVNCEEKGTAEISGLFYNWDPNYYLAVANEYNSNYPWLGELYFLAVYDRALEKDNIDICYNYFSQGVAIDAKVFLQGTFKEGSMQTALSVPRILPMSQPYKQRPWNYLGTENIRKIIPNIVDWVLVELRSAPNSSSTAARKAALLRSDGKVVGLDGKSILKFSGILPGNYYLVVKHRNHLGVMSRNPLYLSSQSTFYDFSTAPESAYGSDALANLGDGIYGMYSGDGDGNGIVNILDYGTVANNIFKVGYNSGDLDLSTTIDVIDYSKASQSMLKISKVPD